jgi:TetR/AcrR family transcriptional regulator, regulator of mycofactocin system
MQAHNCEETLSVAETTSNRGPGRPPTTTREEVARVGFALFVEHGFDTTTMDDIAAALGVGRRTLFRYYPSKNDLVWGEFDQVLDRLRIELRSGDQSRPIIEVIRDAAVESNTYPEEMLDELHTRLSLIQSVPALQGHSMLRYAEWREVIAEYVAERLGCAADELVPVATGHAALAASTAAFSRWVAHPSEDVLALIDRSYGLLVDGFAIDPSVAPGTRR